MRLYNTLTKKIELFIPNNDKKVKIYTCGPTVYDYAHIGNLRTYIYEDILEKTLLYRGYEVERVMNITDVGHMTADSDTGEDKMLIGAKRENKDVLELAKYYTNAFFEDCKKLNISKPKIVENASDHIAEFIKIIKTLLDKGCAYQSNGNIYFDVTMTKDYYKLSGMKEEDLLIGAREDVEEDDNKKNPSDFGLWFTSSKFNNQLLTWDSPWGVGYPGWHIECSGIALKFLGEKLDIHCGGVDNIFPHHTNEIAQTEAYTGKRWCNYWLHGEHLNIATSKMSKSSGEFLTLKLLEEKGYNPLTYRFFVLQSHYRKQLVFSYDSMDSATISYTKLKNRINNLKINEDDIIDDEAVKNYRKEFASCIGNDMNTAGAFTIVFNVLKDKELNDKTKNYLIEDFDKVFSLDLNKKTNIVLESDFISYVEDKIKERKTAKEEGNYELADIIRKELLDKKVILSDEKEITKWRMEE